MTSRAGLIISMVLFLSGWSCSSMPTRADAVETEADSSVDSNAENCVTLPFRFVVVRDTLKSANLRDIEILLDSKAYSVENLKILFSYLSEKNVEPQYLTITVYTEWSQLELPSDCPGSGHSGNHPSQQHKLDFHHAKYFRRGDNVFFRYSSALGTEKLETFVIKGKALGSPIW